MVPNKLDDNEHESEWRYNFHNNLLMFDLNAIIENSLTLKDVIATDLDKH